MEHVGLPLDAYIKAIPGLPENIVIRLDETWMRIRLAIPFSWQENTAYARQFALALVVMVGMLWLTFCVRARRLPHPDAAGVLAAHERLPLPSCLEVPSSIDDAGKLLTIGDSPRSMD